MLRPNQTGTSRNTKMSDVTTVPQTKPAMNMTKSQVDRALPACRSVRCGSLIAGYPMIV